MLAAALAAAAACHAARAGRSAYNPVAPNRSLATLPVTYHALPGKGKQAYPRSEDEIATFAKFRLVVIEKWEGPCWLQCLDQGNCTPACGEEDYILGTLRRVKQRNPAVCAVMYLNSLMDFRFYRLHQRWADAGALLRNANGSLAMVNNDNGMDGIPVPDWSQPAAAEIYLSVIANATASGVVDGIFADKANVSPKCKHIAEPDACEICNSGGCGVVPTAVGEAWGTGHHAVLRAAQAQLGDGVVMNREGSNDTVYYTWSNSDRAAGIATATALHQSGVRNTIAYAKHCEDADVAAFLMAVEEGVFIMCIAWDERFEQPLGDPTGPAVKSGSVYSRSFASGTSATYDAKADVGTINWGGK